MSVHVIITKPYNMGSSLKPIIKSSPLLPWNSLLLQKKIHCHSDVPRTSHIKGTKQWGCCYGLTSRLSELRWWKQNLLLRHPSISSALVCGFQAEVPQALVRCWFCGNLSGISPLTPMRPEEWWCHPWSEACITPGRSPSMGLVCILILYSRTTRWGR